VLNVLFNCEGYKQYKRDNPEQIGRDIKKHKKGECLCVRMRYNENIEYIDT